MIEAPVILHQLVEHFLTLVPHAHYVDVSGAGHMVAGDRNDAFTESVADFILEHFAPEGESPQ